MIVHDKRFIRWGRASVERNAQALHCERSFFFFIFFFLYSCQFDRLRYLVKEAVKPIGLIAAQDKDQDGQQCSCKQDRLLIWEWCSLRRYR